MRIVIDGAHGSGKTTFLKGVIYNERVPCINQLGYTIFSDLIGKSFFEGRKIKIVPPQNESDWNKLFYLILEKGINQFEEGKGEEIYWYDRGIPYINVISQMDNIPLPIEIFDKIRLYTYDYVFVFEPIESCDFTKIRKAGCRTFSIADRYDCVDKTYRTYAEAGNKVYRVPVFSADYNVNFKRRFEFISNIIENEQGA